MDLQLVLEQRAKVEEFRRKHRIGLLTLLFTDLVGSTKLKQELGDHEAVALIQRHHALVREILGRFKEGEEIGTAGDSFFIVFTKPSDAAQFSLMLQNRLRREAQQTTRPLLDRIGIHIGEVVVEERPESARPKDLYGLQVDICARVMSLAGGDQILLTRSAFDNARQVLKGQDIEGLNRLNGLQWLNHGPYVLKGVEEPLEICEIGELGEAVLKPPPDSEKVHRYVSPDSEPVLGWRPAIGQVVPGTQWTLEDKLGEGGFGEVWIGRHQTLREHRVFKFCFRADRVRPLKREVTIFRLLKERVGNHPNIVSVHDVLLNEPPYYLMMDYDEGKDLRSWFEEQGGIDNVPLATRLEIVAQVADALQAAHDAGVIHRDVKPSNILVRGNTLKPNEIRVKLTDFGIGQVVAQEALAGMTKLGFTQTMMSPGSSTQSGTHLYMAPELLAGKPSSIRSDIYSLGVVLYQMLVGDLSRPLTVDWAKEISDAYLRDDLTHCFAGDPQERFAGVGLLARNLRSLQQRKAAEVQQRATVRRRVVRAIASTVAICALVPFLIWVTLQWREASGAETALKNLGAVYKRLKSYQDTAVLKVEADFGGVKQDIDGSARFALAKPDKLDLTVSISKSVTKLISNGRQAWTLAALGSPQYTLRELTNSPAEAVLTNFLKDPFISVRWLGIGPVASLRLYSILASANPQGKLLKHAKHLKKLGSEKVEGSAAYVFCWEDTNGPVTVPIKVWVSKESGLILKKTADLKSMFNEARKLTTNLPPAQKMVVTSTHRDIKINEPVSESFFVFDPPPEARKVERFSLNELIAALLRGSFPSFDRAALKEKIPVRDPRANLSLIDLSDYYNAPLTEIWHSRLEGNNLSPLPRGLQTFAGVEFDCRGLIQLASQKIKNEGAKYPEQVGIPIGLRCQRLHFLHSAIFGEKTANGAKIGSYVLRYADGQQQEFPLIYGKDVVDWWSHKSALPTNSVLAWEGTNEANRIHGKSIRLFMSTWDNPLGSLKIDWINFVSEHPETAPFLVALSADLVDQNSARGPRNVSRELRQMIGVIDLSEHYNASLSEVWHGQPPNNDLASLPRGLQVLAGTKFDVRGIIQLSSSAFKAAAPRYPEAVNRIKVGRKCQRLHFLHASGWARDADGTRIGNYVIRYSDGQQRQIPIVYGKDVQDWHSWDPNPPTDSIVAWTGENRVSKAQGNRIRLFRSTWENPLPNIAIADLDFVSAMAMAAPFLVALTVDPIERDGKPEPTPMATSSPASASEPLLKSGMVDLSKHFNVSMADLLSPQHGSNSLLPIHKTADGVEFRVGGLIQLSGGVSKNFGERFPDTVEGIRVGHKCRRVHFLHAAGWGGQVSDATEIGCYVVHDSARQQTQISIIYGEDLRSWWRFGNEPQQTLRASVAWTGTSAGATVRLYKRTWNNPRPDLTVERIDFRSSHAGPGPFLVAITTEPLPE